MRRADGITTGLADEDDFTELARVVAAAFPDNPKADPAILRWQYDAPFGPTTVAVLREGDRIVGQWAALPFPAIVDGRPGLVARTADAAILPSHRGRGLWPMLARTLFDICAAARMPIAFSYPNDQSVAGLRRVGWTSLGEMRAHVIVTGDEWVAQRLHVPTSVARLGRRAAFSLPGTDATADRVDTLPPDTDELWSGVSAGLTHTVVRNLAWQRWRYADRPGKTYRYYEVRLGGDLAGLAVAAPRRIGSGTFADVLELLAVDDDHAAALVGAMHADLGPEVDGLVLGALLHSPLSDRVRACGFRVMPRALQDAPLRAGAVDTAGTRPELLTAPWALQWGDMDHL